MMVFEEAFRKYIEGQKIIACGFQLLKRAKQPNGYFAEIGGYYTSFENGFNIFFSGASLGDTPVQEAMIVDANNFVIARDTDDLRWPAGEDPYQ